MSRVVSLPQALAVLVVLSGIAVGTATGATLDPDRVLDGADRWPTVFTPCNVGILAGSGSGVPGSSGNAIQVILTFNAPLTALELNVEDVPDLLVATGCTSLVPGFDCAIVDSAGRASVSLTSPSAAVIPAHATNAPVASVSYSVSAAAPAGTISLVPVDVVAIDVNGTTCGSIDGAGQFTVLADTDGDGVPDRNDGCPNDPEKTRPGICGCGVPDTDTDGDGAADCIDGCPNDPAKTEPGVCGCGVPDTDTDGDGAADCVDGCPNDPAKTEPGVCGCGVPDTDTDGDGAADCVDGCPNDPAKTEPGVCGCGVPDTDTDGDGTADCNDGCPTDPTRTSPGPCGCNAPDDDSDTDGDGVPNCIDGCPNDPFKSAPGACGCGVADTDSDGDGAADCIDECPDDPLKIEAGFCGCGVPETDTDGDFRPDCVDGCPDDPSKTRPGVCGCGVPDTDSDGDGTADCIDGCPHDPGKVEPGICGCGVPDTDTDGDIAPDCVDECPTDPTRTVSGICGCDDGSFEVDRDTPAAPIRTMVPSGTVVAEFDSVLDGAVRWPVEFTPCNVGILAGAGSGSPGSVGNAVHLGLAYNNVPLTVVHVDIADSPDLLVATGCTSLVPGFTCIVDEKEGGAGVTLTSSFTTIPVHSTKTPIATLQYTVAADAPLGPIALVPDKALVFDVNNVVCATTVGQGKFVVVPPEVDTDGDGTPDCIDGCPNDPAKIEPGVCGCGVPDIDGDSDGTPNCIDECPDDPSETEAGDCGCGVPDPDSDNDGNADCIDPCPDDAQDDADGDGLCAGSDNCSGVANADQADLDDDGFGDACDADVDGDGVATPLDCDDRNAAISPNADEICGNAVDEDCSGADAVCGGCEELPRAGWSVTYVDSEELAGREGSAANAIDGDPLTHWVTRWIPESPGQPHEIRIDTGALRVLCGFSYLPRQDGGVNGTIRGYELALSVDGVNWNTVAGGELFTSTASLVERQVDFEPTPGRHVRLRSLSEVHGGPWAVVAELGLQAFSPSGSAAPIPAIDAPEEDALVDSGQALDFEGSSVDPDGNLPLTFWWGFPACASPSVSFVEDPGPVVFGCPPGAYPVTLTVCDAAGACATAQLTIAVSGPLCSPVPSSDWSVTFVDSEELFAEDGSGENAIDLDPLTHWVTQWSPVSPAHPHEIQLDTGEVRTLCGFNYLPRQDGGVNGTIREYGFAVSVDGANWTTVATGVLYDRTWNLVERQVDFAPAPGRYVRLRSLGAVENGPWAVVAELGVRGLSMPESVPPTAVIDAPAADVSIVPEGTVVFEATGSDPDGELPLTFHWSFPACAVPSSSRAEDAGPVVFRCPAGEYSVSFTACDAAGLCESAQRIVSVVDGACGALSRAGWTVAYVDSEELVREDGRATNAIDGDPSTIWVTQWAPVSPPVPHEIHIDLGSAQMLCGFTYLQRQDGGINGTIREYAFDVSDDGVSWTTVSLGLLAADQLQVDFAPVGARQVRLRALSEINGGPWTTAAEIGIRAE